MKLKYKTQLIVYTKPTELQYTQQLFEVMDFDRETKNITAIVGKLEVADKFAKSCGFTCNVCFVSLVNKSFTGPV